MSSVSTKSHGIDAYRIRPINLTSWFCGSVPHSFRNTDSRAHRLASIWNLSDLERLSKPASASVDLQVESKTQRSFTAARKYSLELVPPLERSG